MHTQAVMAFQIQPEDNVAVLLDDLVDGQVAVCGACRPGVVIRIRGRVRLGHKIALRGIQAGEPVVKHGVRIGHALTEIRTGDWVHLHNCASDLDERSNTLDVISGVPTDTAYE